MNQDHDPQLSNLFAEQPAVQDAQEFMARVDGKLTRKRRIAIAIQVALVLAALVTAAPAVKGIVLSLLDIAGLSTT